jgi:predicted ATPase/class 3 adenylate cyclase
MPELLTGTVTFLFSDIEGSTRLTQSLGDAWPSILDRHQHLLRAAFGAEGGREAGTEGDSFFVAFPTAPAAVAAAVAAQRALAAEPWPADGEVRVRVGLHTGDAGFSTDSYVGLHVHRASRIASAGHGGQVLLSDTTRVLVEGQLPDDVDLRDLGEHRLKDLERPERLWQLVIPGLQDEFPPIGSLDAVPNNLPTRLTTFLGREHEIAEIASVLERSRLLTLTGPGGTGKTRLSLEVAGRVLARYPDGVFFVELASITEPDLVAGTVAQTLGLPDRGGRSSMERLTDAIGEKRMLLVLDNFEQVVEAAPLIADLLEASRHLTVLTSSRQVLRVSGEQEYPVPPLGLPDPANLPPLTQLGQFESVALFIERARSVKPDFEVTNDNAPAVAEICVRLDGLPLAIELAAARIRILTPQAMLGRLEHRLGLLASGSRDLPERQQTLRGAIAWSHDMLDDTDAAMFACLAVFVGSAGLDAIDRLCGGEVSGDPIDALESLVEKSLVRQSEGVGGEPRFAMLETIREFAVEQAIARDRWDSLRAGHAAHFLAVAEDSATKVMGSDKRAMLDRLEQDHDNLRAAMTWAVETHSAETALRLGAAVWRFWQMRGHLVEGLERLERALALEHGAEHPAARADALDAAAGLAYWLSDTDRSRRFYTEEIQLRRALDDRRGLAEALYGIAFTYAVIGLREERNAEGAIAYVNEALGIFREIGDEAGIGRCQWALANVEWGTGRLHEALRDAREALEVFRKIDDRFMVGWSSYTIGITNLALDRAEGGNPDRRHEARDWLRQALTVFTESDDISGYTLVVDSFAVIAWLEGDLERAARISGAVSQLERASGTALNLWNRAVLGFVPGELQADPALAQAWTEGVEMSAAEAVAYALEPGTA